LSKSVAGDRIAIIDTERVGERIVLGTSRYYDAIVGSTLRDCEIVITRSGSTFARSSFVGCQFVARRPVSRDRIWGSFVDCSFRGVFSGCRFGGNVESAESPAGGLVRCDFSAARLRTCELFGADVASMAWPPWPSIAVVDPVAHAEAWLAIPLPPELAILQRVLAEGNTRECVVVVDLAAEKVDPDLVWPLVADEPYVVFAGKAERAAGFTGARCGSTRACGCGAREGEASGGQGARTP
jgi:hypothetical protein